MTSTPERRAELGFFSLLFLGINGIVGVGIFFVPSRLAELVPGQAGISVYAVTALALIPVACVYAVLGGRFREDGGPYVWARAAFGDTVGFFVGWIAWVSALFSLSAVIAGLSTHAGGSIGIQGEPLRRLFGVGCAVLFAAIAASGLRPSAWVWNGVTVLKLLPLLLLIALFAGFPAKPQVEQHAPVELVDLWRGALLLVFAFQGFEIVPVPAGHARAARWTIPAATVGSLAIAAVIYLLLHAACVRALPELAKSTVPLVDSAAVFGGPRMAFWVSMGTNVSAVGIAFGMFAMTPRLLAALGHSEGLGPWILREDARGVPQRALVITLAFVVLPLVIVGSVAELFVLSSVAVLTQYAVSSAALVVLALKQKNGVQRWHLLPAPLALGAVVLVAQAARLSELLVAYGMLGVGAVVLVLRRLAAAGDRG
jgi:basic amino acid/polyamine antiporter, APA family